MKPPAIAVIIPAKNASATIRKCLDSILALDYPDYEVIVVDDGSKDETPQILKAYKTKFKLITLSGVGPSAARNMAAKETDAQYLAFTDADCIVDRLWIGELLKGFVDNNVAAVGGIQAVPEDESSFGRQVFILMKKSSLIADYIHSANGHIASVRHNPSCNVMYRKDVLLQEGGFLAGLWPGEDTELDYRLKKKGYRLFFNPKAIVYHYRSQNLRSFLKMMFRYGSAQGILVRKYGIFRRLQLVPIIAVMLAILLPVSFLANSSIALSAVLLIITSFLLYFGSIRLLILFVLLFIFWHAGFINGLTKDII